MATAPRIRPDLPVEFWSSVECGAFQSALVRELRSLGWQAGERYGVTQAAYWGARSRWARGMMRFRTYGLYPARLAASGRSPGIAVVTSNTFFAPRVAQAFGSHARPVVNWVFDLFPDVLLAAGAIRENGSAARILRGIMARTFDRAAANVFLGDALKRFAEARFGPIPRAHVIPVGADGGPFRSRPPVPAGVEAVRILYSGNLGRMHDADTVAELLQHGGPPAGTRFAFRGNGAGFRRLRSAARTGAAVEIGGNLPAAEWVDAMCAAGVALVTLRPGAGGLVMPSKTYSAMMAGQAILAICPLESDLATLVSSTDSGWVVRPGEVALLKSTLEHLAARPEEVFAKRMNAWTTGHREFDQSRLAPRWDALLASVGRVASE